VSTITDGSLYSNYLHSSPYWTSKGAGEQFSSQEA
jgi:hypothetical protein